MQKLILKNAKIVSSKEISEGSIFIENGKIVAPFDVNSADQILDLSGKFVMPGAIDVHVHFREPGGAQKETWESASQSAVMGGVTSVLDMPNNDPAIISVQALEEKRKLIKGRSFVNYAFHFGGAGYGNIDEIRKAENIPAVKVYMGSSTGNLLLDEPSIWQAVFEVCLEKNIPVIVHAENEERIKQRSKEFAGIKDVKVHAEIRDCQCAKIATKDAILLREKIGNKLHIAHMSCGRELELVKEYANPNLTCEVAPHHLYFSIEDMKDGFLKMNPPLRHEEDLRLLWEGVRAENINCIATDHAPHTKDEKSLGLSAPSGVPGVEFLLPLMLNEVSENMLNLQDLARLLCEEPARIFSLKNKGFIQEGMDADLTILDMDLSLKIEENMILSKCGWSPYTGRILKGWPITTIVNGQIAMQDRKIIGQANGKEILIQN